MVAELAAYKSMAVVTQAEAEMVEEGRINCLMRKLTSVVQEKGRVVQELEREEEMLTNTLQKKLFQVRREKAQLEQQIEKEHEDNVLLRAQLLSRHDKEEEKEETHRDNNNDDDEQEEEGEDNEEEKEQTKSNIPQNGATSTNRVNRLASRFQSTLEPFHDE